VREIGSAENLHRSWTWRKKKTYRWPVSLKDATNIFNARTGCGVVCTTVKKDTEAVLFQWKQVFQVNREERSRMCRNRLQWTVDNQWSSFIFSDETKIVLEITIRFTCWGRQTGDWDPSALVCVVTGRRLVHRASIMFWGCTSHPSCSGVVFLFMELKHENPLMKI
jgi:hypothetical protein